MYCNVSLFNVHFSSDYTFVSVARWKLAAACSASSIVL